MNFAQLIDPERVQAREDPLGLRRAPCEPLGSVVHHQGVTRPTLEQAVAAAEVRDVFDEPTTLPEPARPAPPPINAGDLAASIRRFIAASRTPFVTPEAVALELGEERQRASQGDLVRNGPYGAKVFGLSDQGRQKLRPIHNNDKQKQHGDDSGKGAHGR